MSDLRRAARLVVNAPAVVESIGQVPMYLHPNLQAVFRRVEADTTTLGKRFPAVVRDLSTNGAFISGITMPLLARVAIKFEIRGIGPIDAVGWVLWQRTADCELPGEGGGSSVLPKGFGVLFESIPLETRAAIAAFVARQ
ncbi:MAG TPA: PilZ domain-containing protein [Kofleriaceae bacterium]|nr:PilZ domain-containing protein [Kofleriaceae bacterium]